MSVTVQTITQDPSVTTLKDVKGFFVPTILSFNLNKTSEDRAPAVETENLSSRQNGVMVTEDDEGVMDLTSMKKGSNSGQHTSFLLDPFFKPVAQNLESNKENPVLKALFGTRTSQDVSPWTSLPRTSISNCHPFKKTELSHDLTSDDTPVQVPKSLLKKQSRIRKSPAKRESCPEPKAPVLREVLRSNTSTVSATTDHFSVKNSNLGHEKTYPPLSIFNGKKKLSSYSIIPPAKPRMHYINNDRLIQLRTMVDNAVKNHKVYSMTGSYSSVRNALKQRGWIEKIDSDVKGRRKFNKFEEIGLYDAAFQFVQKYHTVAAMRLAMQTNTGFAHNDQIHYTGQGEAEIINRMLKNVTEDLCWLSKPYPYYCWKDFDKFEMINRLPRAYFSNKIGLCNSLQQIQWFYEPGVCSTQFPRTYNMSLKEEIDAFKEDFRLTSCVSLLKWFLQTYKMGGEAAVRSPDGKIDINIIEFALRRCAEYVRTKQHEDIDVLEMPKVWEYQWDQFIAQYYRIVNEGQILKDSKEGITIKAIVSNAQSMLNILKPHWPQFDIDGYKNFWIVKPGGRCCGAGIVIKSNLEQILLLVNPGSMRETRFVVQKYIERPLLIYNTKFDIRQWFLVTNVYPLTVWMYKESYLRFCSQPFTLKNTHEAIHLCNNAVQRKYKNAKRDRGLPEENMWDCYTFQTYLKTIGYPDVWEKHIYPGMKEGFIGALLASQDNMERKKNCFELYGADFMISETLTDGPWLIEINSNPAMDSSTSVTARMCPQVLEDIIKVVIDRKNNRNASTGAFEMVYKQNCPPVPPYLGMSLCIKGKKASKRTEDLRSLSRKSKSKISTEPIAYTDTEEESTGEEIVSAGTSCKDAEVPKECASLSSDGNSGRLSPQPSNPNQKILPGAKPDEAQNKRRKIDWVRKNIEKLKSTNATKKPKMSTATTSHPGPQSGPKERASAVAKAAFRDEVLKLLGTVEMKEFIREMLKLKKTYKEKPRKRSSGAEVTKKTSGSLEDVPSECEISEETRNTLLGLLHICQQKAEGEALEWESIFEETRQLKAKYSTKSCPNFDSTFERELKKADERAQEKKAEGPKFEDSFDSYFSATSLDPKTNSKTSLDYFRNWRWKLNETRRTCEDMLAKLQVFQEENFKVKFKEALKKRIKEEVELLDGIRALRKSQNSGGKGASGSREGRAEDGGRPACKPWDPDGSHGLIPLAISSETGAVRAVGQILPRVRQKSRPPLPDGSDGKGRKTKASDKPTHPFN